MKQAGRPRSKYKWVIAGFFVLSICTTAALIREKLLADEQTYDVIATVDGIPITLPEFSRAAQRNKSGILNYFHEKYGAEQTSGFWTTAYGGEVPLDALKKKALDDSVRIKVRQWIAMDQGILKHIGYPEFLKQLQQENARRAKAVANRQVIYGPVRYNEDTYFEYIMTNATTAVKQKMQLDDESKPDERALKAFYELHKDELYQTPGVVKVVSMSISFLDSDRNADPSKKVQATKQLEEAYAKLESGASFSDIAKIYSDEEAQQELVFHLGNSRHNSRSPVARAAEKMSTGETSGIIEENGSLYLMKCTEKTDPGSMYAPYPEIKEQVLKDYIDNEYEVWVRKKMDQAHVEVNESLYRSWTAH